MTSPRFLKVENSWVLGFSFFKQKTLSDCSESDPCMLGVLSFSLPYLFGDPQTVEKALVFGLPKGATGNMLLSQVLHTFNAPNSKNLINKTI